jgi:parallel beta-helix repeat protein
LKKRSHDWWRIAGDALALWWRFRRESTGWPLLKRIAWAEAQAVRPRPADWPPPRYADDLPQRWIAAEAFTAERFRQELQAICESRGDLHLPPGCVELTEPISLPSGVRLIGTPGKTELRFRDSHAGIIILGSEAAPVIGTAVEHLRLRLSAPSDPFSYAVCASGVDGLCLRDIEILSPECIGFLLVDHVRRSTLERCRVYDGHGDGFALVRSVVETRLSSCLAEGCRGMGLLLADWALPEGCDSLDFHRQFAEMGNWVGFAPHDPGPLGIQLDGCTFRGNRKMGICSDGSGHVRVVGCLLADNECEGMTLDNGTWGCLVENCHIRGNGRRGHQRGEELSEDQVAKDGLLPDGTSKVKLPGISLDNAAYCRISGNCIEGNFGDGVKFVRAAAWNRVEGNLIQCNNRGWSKGHPHFGVRFGADATHYPGQVAFASSFNVVSDNDIIGDHVAPIQFNRGTVGNRLERNTFRGMRERPRWIFNRIWNRILRNQSGPCGTNRT